MTSLDTTYACPRCHLRFPQLAELRGHIVDEHPSPVDAEVTRFATPRSFEGAEVDSILR